MYIECELLGGGLVYSSQLYVSSPVSIFISSRAT